jgi:hypothetical protein
MHRIALLNCALNQRAITGAQSVWAEVGTRRPPSLEFMVRSVGIDNVEDIRRIQLIPRNVDDLDGSGRWKLLRLHYSSPISTQIRNMLIKNYLHQLSCCSHPRLPYLFRQPHRNFKLFKNFAAPFPKYNSDATGAQSEVNCFLAGGEVMLTLFGAVKSSITGTALLCSSALDCSLVRERPGSCYRRAVFIGDDLAV